MKLDYTRIAFAAMVAFAWNVRIARASVAVYDGEIECGSYVKFSDAIKKMAGLTDPRIVFVSDGSASQIVDEHRLTANCTITATEGTVVRTTTASALSIASGVRVELANIELASASLPVSVAAGGVLALSGSVTGLGEVTTADSSGFELAGVLTGDPVTLVTPDAAAGETFGWYSIPADDAASCLSLLLPSANNTLQAALGEGGTLVWERRHVADEDAVARVISPDRATTNNVSSLKSAFDSVAEGGEVELLKDCELQEAVTVSTGFTVCGPADVPVTLTPSSSAGIRIVAGGALTIRNLTITGYQGPSLLVVDGGALTLESGAWIRDCVSTDFGGGVYLNRGVLTLNGGQITGCHAEKGGGGVFIGADGFVQLAGAVCISGNTSGALHRRDNLRLPGTDVLIGVIGSLDDGASIGVGYAAKTVFAGHPFAIAAGAVDGSAARQAFFADDETATCSVAWDASSRSLGWEEPVSSGECDPDLAVACVVYAGGDEHYYATIDAAFERMRGACTVELLADAEMHGDLAVRDDVVLRSRGDDAQRVLYRSTGTIRVDPGVSLRLEKVCVSGLSLAGMVTDGHRLISVNGGTLTLAGGVVVRDQLGDRGEPDSRADDAIVVYNRGRFIMGSDARIENCVNRYVDPKRVNSGAGGGVLIDGESTAVFEGGAVIGCTAAYGGGVCICNRSTAFVSGELVVTNCLSSVDGSANNFVVEDLSRLYLVASLSQDATIGCTSGFLAETNLVGYVEDWRDWDFTALTNSAAKFFMDERPLVHGFVVTNSTPTAKIVWSTAIAPDGSYASDDGVKYFAAGEVPEIPDDIVEPEPIAFTFIGCNEDRTEWTLMFTNAVQWCNYELYATDSLDDGFKLEGLEPELRFQWESAEREASVTVPANGSQRFWRLVGLPGRKRAQ